ncbi:MAG: sensor histidine kinase [Proteobacteria bacterium]|nr:sensor histidine kinase [Pseudomonadota bacterium]
MMWRDASLSRRLLTAAGGFIAVALLIAAVLIGFVLHRFVQGQIDQRLDTQIVFLTSMLRIDGNGRISLAGNADGPPFERKRRGWYWQVTGPINTLRSASLDGADLRNPVLRDIDERRPPPPMKDHDAPEERPRPADGPGPDNDHLHYRIKQMKVGTTDVMVVVSAPRGAVLGPLREAMTTLGISLALLGLALVLAMVLQIRLGLRPLERLRRALADVRNGGSERVPSRQPQEIRPVVDELNALLDQNAANLERARRHVANLAHGLKTPLATLAIATSIESPRDPLMLQRLVTQMERRIRHHLGRARMAALNGPARAQTQIAPRLQDLGDVLGKIHSDRSIAFSMDVPVDLAVACEQQDFDEMAGNLLDNAFIWARTKVTVSAVRDDAMLHIIVDDDGPGLAVAQREQVLRPGERLDEAAPGFGFGLSIVSELAELYGGSIELGEAPLGGLRAMLRLPAGSPN